MPFSVERAKLHRNRPGAGAGETGRRCSLWAACWLHAGLRSSNSQAVLCRGGSYCENRGREGGGPVVPSHPGGKGGRPGPPPPPVTSALRDVLHAREGRPAGGPPGAGAGAGAQVGPTPNGLEPWGARSRRAARAPTRRRDTHAGDTHAGASLAPKATGPRRPEGGQQCCHHEAAVDPGKGSVVVSWRKIKLLRGLAQRRSRWARVHSWKPLQWGQARDAPEGLSDAHVHRGRSTQQAQIRSASQ